MEWGGNATASGSLPPCHQYEEYTNSTAPADPKSPLFPSFLQGVVLAASLATAAAASACCRVIYRRTEVSHPVYAVLLQEVAVLSALAWVMVAATSAAMLVMAAGSDLHLAWAAEVLATGLVPATALQFSQGSWCVITYQRYIEKATPIMSVSCFLSIVRATKIRALKYCKIAEEPGKD